MINKRLIGTVSESKKYIAGNVLFQWVGLLANITMIFFITAYLQGLLQKTGGGDGGILVGMVIAAAAAVRFICTVLSSRMSYLSSRAVKAVLREKIYQKLLKLGASYKEQVRTAEVVQVSVEGVDQLETYFGAYLPQFFYAMLAPLTLFLVLLRVNVPSAVVLFVCVPLIPASIAAVQTWAKKLLSKYWGQYTALGDTFLENLQGLTTLKIYQADAFKNKEMNEESEKFRKITMKVLTMQLNSITIMDIIAYGGAALGVFFSVTQYQKGGVDLAGALLVILLSADFFIPMRQLGSFFHIAMNGMAASDKIFALLDLPEPEEKNGRLDGTAMDIEFSGVRFSYETDREILKGIDMEFPAGSFTSLVGTSGCGKSTAAAILMGRNLGYQGSVTIEGKELSEIQESSLMDQITLVSHNSYLFKGTVRDNLRMGNPDASDSEMKDALQKVRLLEFLENQNGLDTVLEEQGSNFSGGQRQRLAIARALLHDTPMYILDEAASNIDVESEDQIMEVVRELAKTKTILFISHRLANVTASDCIYMMEKGEISESGTHEELMLQNGSYAAMFKKQQDLCRIRGIES